MHLIILGGSGFIGNRVRKYFSKKIHWSVESPSTNELDLTDKGCIEILKNKITPQTTVLFCSTISRLREDSMNAFQKNIAMAHHVAEALASTEYNNLIFCSSIDVYGRPPTEIILNEESKINPFGYYGLAKFVSEKILINIQNSYNKLSILRLPGVYSLEENDKSPLGEIFNRLKNNKAIPLSGGGLQHRCYLNILELCLIIDDIITQSWNGLLNLGFSQSISLRKLTELMKHSLQSSSEIIESDKNGTEFDISINTTKISKEISSNCAIPFANYLKFHMNEKSIYT